jgi:hypothetical protein
MTPKKSEGLDWEAIREEYKKKATPEELDGPFDEAGHLKKNLPKKEEKDRLKTSRKGPTAGRQSFADMIPYMVEHYEAGETLTQIAEACGVNPQTVRNYLRKEEVYDPTRDKGGSLPKDKCHRGHDLSDGFVNKKGARDCRVCNKERRQRRNEAA